MSLCCPPGARTGARTGTGSGTGTGTGTGTYRSSSSPRSVAPCARRRPRASGFTLIEMVVVLAIMGVLAAAAQPLQALMHRRQQEQVLRESLRIIRQALDAYRQTVEARRIAPGPDGSPWPGSLSALVQGVPLLDDQGQPRRDDRRLYLLRRLPRDPFAAPDLPAEATWARRASASGPGDFSGGADVFDVASRSSAQALDGTAYRGW